MILGIDEVGRGALAGPVVVGAVQTPDPGLVVELLAVARIPTLRDSKKLTRLQRERIFVFLEKRLVWAVGLALALEVDELGLSAALRLAAGRAIEQLPKPERILADASLYHPFEKEIPTERFVKGDERFLEISLASIMAKVWRDRWMVRLGERLPGYGFERHVGYGTKKHYQALDLLGLSGEHRESFLKKRSTGREKSGSL